MPENGETVRTERRDCRLQNDDFRQNKTQIFHQNIIDAPETSWYFIFDEKCELFKGKLVEKQGRKARRG